MTQHLELVVQLYCHVSSIAKEPNMSTDYISVTRIFAKQHKTTFCRHEQQQHYCRTAAKING